MTVDDKRNALSVKCQLTRDQMRQVRRLTFNAIRNDIDAAALGGNPFAAAGIITVDDGGHQFCTFEQLALGRSEEHTSEIQSLMRTSYDVFCLKKKKSITD